MILDTEGKSHGETVIDMLTYFENIGASLEEIQKSKLICIDSSGGGALPYIAWAFKNSKDILKVLI